MVWASGGWGEGVEVSEFFGTKDPFFFEGGVGRGILFYKSTRNPNLTKTFFFLRGGGGGGGGGREGGE